MNNMKRPIGVSIFSVGGFILTLFSFLVIFSPSIKKLGVWFPALFGLLVAANFISYVGIWHMKKWGVFLLVIAAFAQIALSLLTNQMGILIYINIFLWICTLVACTLHFKTMDGNF
jgi:hypothetical protein